MLKFYRITEGNGDDVCRKTISMTKTISRQIIFTASCPLVLHLSANVNKPQELCIALLITSEKEVPTNPHWADLWYVFDNI